MSAGWWSAWSSTPRWRCCGPRGAPRERPRRPSPRPLSIPAAPRSEGRRRSLVGPQHGEEGVLRDVHAADALHALLACLLLLDQLALAGDVAAVALGDDVLADRPDALAGDDARADGGLQHHLEELARDQLPQLLDQRLAAGVGLVAMNDERQRVDSLAVDHDVEPHQVAAPVAAQGVVEGG